MSSNYYIGLISGTSMDGVDAVLVKLHDDPHQTELIATHLEPLPTTLKNQAMAISLGEITSDFRTVAKLDVEFGELFALSVKNLLAKTSITPDKISAIGSHGQTLWHSPQPPYPFTLQIGDPNIIAARTHITTVSDFRRADIALGGQGAPLVPRFHEWFFGSNPPKIILNIGGIANITLLSDIGLGFDTGPGNGLMDAWTQIHLQQPYDKNGTFARSGKCNNDLLNRFLSDPYFAKSYPKSAGKDYFNIQWINRYSEGLVISKEDIQATLLELTVITIINAILPLFKSGEILVCGGGCHNDFLMEKLQKQLGQAYFVGSTQLKGLDPDWVEAFCFAWLAKKRIHHEPINLMPLTGSTRPVMLGGIYA